MAYLMIVDDDEDFANAAATVLRDAGHEVAVESTVGSAAEAMERRAPDVAIIDVIFPEDISAGFELARKMRRDEGKLASVPILMLTAVNRLFPFGFGPGDIGSDSLPVSDFLDKPVDLDVVKERVSALLADADASKGDRGS